MRVCRFQAVERILDFSRAGIEAVFKRGSSLTGA
jgi:hypothetical protein